MRTIGMMLAGGFLGASAAVFLAINLPPDHPVLGAVIGVIGPLVGCALGAAIGLRR